MRIDDPEWEGFGVYADALGTDRTKIIETFIGHCLGRPVQLPAPAAPAELAPRLSAAADAVREQLTETKDAQQRAILERRLGGLLAMLDEVKRRAEEAG